MKRNKRSQRGFTLIELLVVIAILAVLFGITALALNNVGSNAEQVTACAERDVVQTAIDVYVAQNNTITAGSGQVSPGNPPVGPYLRRASKYYYTWDANGYVSNIVTSTSKTFTCP